MSLVDLLLLLPAVFVFVFIGVFIIVSESVFWFVELLVLLPEFEMVGLVVVRMIDGCVFDCDDKNLLLLVMVEEMVVLRPP